MKGNKGFAISGMLYALLILFLIILLLILGTLGSRKLILDKAKNDVYNDIIKKIGQEQQAAYKIINEQTKTGSIFPDSTTTGIDARIPFSSKYYFRGSDPSNFLVSQGQCYRIISISQNNTIKVIYEGVAVSNQCASASTTTSGRLANTIVWNNHATNNWFHEGLSLSSLRQSAIDYSSGTMQGVSIPSITDRVENGIWYVGAVRVAANSLLEHDVANERTFQGNSALTSLQDLGAVDYDWLSRVGTISPTEFIKASGNIACGYVYNSNTTTQCSINNYLLKDYNWWTMNADAVSQNKAMVIGSDGRITTADVSSLNNFRPVLYLKATITITGGSGTRNSPYIVS